MAKVRTSLRPAVKVIAVIMGPLFVGGLLAAAGVLAFYATGPGWYRYPLVALTAGVALFCAWQMLETYAWLELDGDTIRAKNFWTRRVTERRIEDVSSVTPSGRCMAWIARFRSGGRLALVGRDMVEPDAFTEAVAERVRVLVEEREGPIALPERAETSFRYTEDFARRSSRRFFTTSHGLGEMLGAVTLAGLYLALRAFGSGLAWLFLVLLGMGAVLDAFGWFRTRRGALALARSLADPMVRIRFEGDAIVSVTEHGEVRLPWSVVSRVWEWDDMLILTTRGRGYLAVPSDALSADEREYIIARVGRAGGRAG